MVDQETLQAIGEMMDKKLDSQTQELRSELGQQIGQQLNLMIENYFDPRSNLLAEGLQNVNEKLKALDDLEVMDTRITALEAMVKKINRELKELKKAE